MVLLCRWTVWVISLSTLALTLTDREIYRNGEIYRDRPTNRPTERHKDWQTDGLADRQIGFHRTLVFCTVPNSKDFCDYQKWRSNRILLTLAIALNSIFSFKWWLTIFTNKQNRIFQETHWKFLTIRAIFCHTLFTYKQRFFFFNLASVLLYFCELSFKYCLGVA